MIEKYGGLEDHVLDPFGFKYPLCAGDGGFTSNGRSVYSEQSFKHPRAITTEVLTMPIQLFTTGEMCYSKQL